MNRFVLGLAKHSNPTAIAVRGFFVLRDYAAHDPFRFGLNQA
jgi:hypothetical protein